MAKEFIVAIELGSSKIVGMAGRRNQDGSISVLATVKQNTSDFIRKGVVYKMDKTVQCISNIVNKLEMQLKTKISQVYVGVGGQSIRSIKNPVVRDFTEETTVTQELVNELMDSNRSVEYVDQEKLDVVPLEYKVDQHLQFDPVGIQCRHIEGNFLNILCRDTFYRNLDTCFSQAGVNIAEMCLAPVALADAVLTHEEKRNGCVLVDFGAATTTVAVYFRDVLRHLAVIPLGGSNITRDIASLQIDDALAEEMKLKYACAFTKDEDISPEQRIRIDKDREVESNTFINIVESRLKEIIENVWAQVPQDYLDKLIGGVVVTGGGANMKNIEAAFANFTQMKKIRVARFVNFTVNSTMPESESHDCTLNTILGLLAKGDCNCAGKEIKPELFESGDNANDESQPARPAVGQRQLGDGYVPTPEEKKKAADEARMKREAEKLEEQRKLEAAEREAERLRRENSTLNKGVKKFKEFFRKAVSPEDE